MFQKRPRWILKVSFRRSSGDTDHCKWLCCEFKRLCVLQTETNVELTQQITIRHKTHRQHSIPSQNMGNFRAEKEVLLNYTDVQLSNTRCIA